MVPTDQGETFKTFVNIGEDMVRDDSESIEVVTQYPKWLRYANQPATKSNMDCPMTNGIVVKFWCGW